MIALRILLGAGFVTACCIAAGEFFLRWLGVALERTGRRFIQFIAGAMLVSAFVFGLCAIRKFTAASFVAPGVVLIGLWLWKCRPQFTGWPEIDESRLWTSLFWISWTLFGGMYVIAAMAPEISSDGTGYHLGLVNRYYEHHGFYRITTNMFAGLYQGVEMLFLGAFAIGKHSAAALVHVVFLLLAPFGIVAIARRMGEPRAGVLAAMLFYMAQVVAKAGTAAYIDTATAAVLIAAFYLFQLWREETGNGAFVGASLLTGYAVACKITAVSFGLYGLLAVALLPAAWRERLRRVAWFATLAALPLLPWVIRNIVWFRNPTFPLLNRYFPNPYMYVLLEDEIRRVNANFNNVPLWRIPWEATTGGGMSGIIGPVFLLAPLAILALRSRAGRQVLLAFACIFLTYPANTGGRFLIPSLPFLSLAMSMALFRLPYGSTLAVALLVIHALFSWPLTTKLWNPWYQWRVDVVDLKAALRLTPERQFFRDHWPDYEPGLLLEKFVAPGELVLSPNMGQMAYHRREILGFSDSALGRRALITFSTPVTPPLGNAFTRDIHFRPYTARALRLVAGGAQDTDFRISEIHLFHEGREIPRKPSWRITASGNPWETPLAFDNLRASWWTSGDVIRAKHPEDNWIGVDFGEALTIDRIVVAQHPDQRWIPLRPAFPEGKGWKVRKSYYGPEEGPIPAIARVEAHDELWRLGIRWILMPDSEYGASDVRDHPAEWGVVQAGMINGFRLWKLTEPILKR